MCGIAGRAHAGQLAPLDWDAARGALAHRGPDGSGYQSASGAGWSWELLHTRLAINDLSPAGNQPLTNADGSLVMVFNGEIYNYPELRRRCEGEGSTFRSHMDGEVILQLWEKHGSKTLALLNGIFSVAIANTI